jgi:hypothetical protein
MTSTRKNVGRDGAHKSSGEGHEGEQGKVSFLVFAKPAFEQHDQHAGDSHDDFGQDSQVVRARRHEVSGH